MLRLRRNLEGFLGGKLIRWHQRSLLKQSGLKQCQVQVDFISSHNTTNEEQENKMVHYLQRNEWGGGSSMMMPTITKNGNDNISSSSVTTDDSSSSLKIKVTPPVSKYTKKQKTLILLHGLAADSKQMADFLLKLNIPEEVRVIIPDIMGHGKDLEFVMQEKQATNIQGLLQTRFYTPKEIVDIFGNFLIELNKDFSSDDHDHQYDIIGFSLGGALAYLLKQKHTALIDKTVLIAPGLESCIAREFLLSYLNGTKRQHCFETRDDVKDFFRNSLSPPNMIKKDPIPKFLYQAIIDERNRTTPKRYYDHMMETMIQHTPQLHHENLLKNNRMITDIDTDTDIQSSRLVLWPEYDSICDYSYGKHFFAKSCEYNTKFITLQDSGHLFHKSGQSILRRIVPEVQQYLYPPQ